MDTSIAIVPVYQFVLKNLLVGLTKSQQSYLSHRIYINVQFLLNRAIMCVR